MWDTPKSIPVKALAHQIRFSLLLAEEHTLFAQFFVLDFVWDLALLKEEVDAFHVI